MESRPLRRSVVVFVLLAGCGGAPTAEPELPEGGETAEPEANLESAPEVLPPTADDAEQAAEPSSSAELGAEDLKELIREVLDDPGLDQYLHLDSPGRLPLKIAGPGLPAKLEVIKGSYEVKVVDGPASAKDPVLVFTRIERDGESVRLRYRYDIEGLSGSAVVFKKDGAWRLGANRVIEK